MFDPPRFDIKTLHHIFNNINVIFYKLKRGIPLSQRQQDDLLQLPNTYLVCYLNGFDNAVQKLKEIKPLLKKYEGDIYNRYKETMRILRKVKYQ